MRWTLERLGIKSKHSHVSMLQQNKLTRHSFQASITHDVSLIKNDPFFKPDGRNAPDVVGLLYETETGKLNVVVPAGKA